MKTITLILFFGLFLVLTLRAQVPESFQYQAVVRDANGAVLVNQNVSVRINIITGSVTEYTEIHNLQTNGLGLITLAVGSGNVQSGVFANINWGLSSNYLKVEIDPTGGSSFIDMGTVELLSVPFALHAKTVEFGFSGDYNDLINTPNLSNYDSNVSDDFSGNYIDLTNKPTLAGDVTGDIENNTVAKIQGKNVSSNNPTNGQILKWNNTSQVWEPSADEVGLADGVVTSATISSGTTKTLTLIRSNGLGDITATFTDLVDDADANPTNELQSLTLVGNDLTISSGNTVTIPQNTYTAGTGISISSNQITNTLPHQATNLSQGTRTATSVDVNSSTGTNATLQSASTTQAGVMTAADKTKLDGIATGANNYNHPTGFSNQPSTALSGSDVLSQVTVSTEGHVTGVTSRSLSASDIGAASSTHNHDATDITTGTLSSDRGVLAGSTSNSFISYTGITNSARAFNGGTTNPTGTQRLNYSGYFYATRLYDNGSRVYSSSNTNIGTSSTNYAAGDHTHSSYGVAGTNGQIQFNNSGAFGASSQLFWDNTNMRMGIGLNNPNGKLVVKGNSSATEPLFEIKNNAGQTVFVVYNDSVRIYVDDDPAKTNKGTFAVSGRNSSKAFTHNYLWVTPDSSRVYTGNNLAGFGVRNINGTTLESYMNLTPYNYFIGHNSGTKVVVDIPNSLGVYNSVLGYEAGKELTQGSSNVFMGYMAGRDQTSGWQNVIIGDQAGLNTNTTYSIMVGSQCAQNAQGDDNVYIGYYAGKLTSPNDNFESVVIGSGAGNNTFGSQNTFIGSGTGSNYTSSSMSRSNNIFIGSGAGLYTVAGGLLDGNICIGNGAGYNGSYTGSNQLFIENSNDVTNPLIHGNFSTNRIAFHRTATSYPLQVGTTTTNGNGAYLTNGGVWTGTSSKSFKDRFVTLNSSEVLNKIANMELKGWYYKETQEFHIGPFAEDFYEAFGCGDKNIKEDLGKYIAASDVAGVTMVAVQELIKQLNEQKKINEELLKRIETLEKK